MCAGALIMSDRSSVLVLQAMMASSGSVLAISLFGMCCIIMKARLGMFVEESTFIECKLLNCSLQIHAEYGAGNQSPCRFACLHEVG